MRLRRRLAVIVKNQPNRTSLFTWEMVIYKGNHSLHGKCLFTYEQYAFQSFSKNQSPRTFTVQTHDVKEFSEYHSPQRIVSFTWEIIIYIGNIYLPVILDNGPLSSRWHLKKKIPSSHLGQWPTLPTLAFQTRSSLSKKKFIVLVHSLRKAILESAFEAFFFNYVFFVFTW